MFFFNKNYKILTKYLSKNTLLLGVIKLKKKMTLSDLQIDETRNISNINCTPEIKKRFLDLGFTNGTKITPVLTSPAGNIRAYLIKDTVIAIRDEDSCNIYIEQIGTPLSL